MYFISKIKGNTTSAPVIIIFLLVVTVLVMIMTNTYLVYGQSNQSTLMLQIHKAYGISH